MTFDPAPPASSAQPTPPLEPWSRGRTGHHHPHHPHHHHHHGPGIIPGLVLVAWGGLLLLRELGYVSPALRAIDFWPLVIVGLGLSMVLRRRHLGGALIGLAVTLLGAGLLAQRLGYAPGVARLWPVLLIAAGVGVILKGLTRRHLPRSSSEPVSAGDLQRSVTMGELALAVDSQQFRGGALGVTMGELRADLRRAAMAGDDAVIELSLTMGNIELYVPANWQIVSEVAPFMGVVEDRTEPRPDGAGILKRLVLRGKLTMGAVTIRN